MRMLIPLALAIPAALALFLVMSMLIQPHELQAPVAALDSIGVNLLRSPPAPEPRRPPPPEPPAEAPQLIMQAAQEVMEPWQPPPAFTLRPDLSGFSRGRSAWSYGDGDPLALMQPTGIYPIRARREGIEGWIRVRFTVLPDGRTHNIRIVEAWPEGYFEAHAATSVQRWRFRPAVRDGEAVAQELFQQIDYSLDD